MMKLLTQDEEQMNFIFFYIQAKTTVPELNILLH